MIKNVLLLLIGLGAALIYYLVRNARQAITASKTWAERVVHRRLRIGCADDSSPPRTPIACNPACTVPSKPMIICALTWPIWPNRK